MPNGAVAFSLTAYTVQAGDYSDSGYDTLNLNVNGNIGQTTTSAGSGTAFIGFISTASVSSVTLTGSTSEDFIDIINGELATGSASLPATAPASVALFIGGGIAWLAVRRLRRNSTI